MSYNIAPCNLFRRAYLADALCGSNPAHARLVPTGLKIAVGNRDNIPPVSPLAFRADQTAQNTLEGFILFAPLVITAHVAGLTNAQTELGAAVFFWARVAYIPVYLFGIAYLRTAIWLVSIVGLGMIVWPML